MHVHTHIFNMCIKINMKSIDFFSGTCNISSRDNPDCCGNVPHLLCLDINNLPKPCFDAATVFRTLFHF